MAIAAALGIGTTNTIIAMLVVWWPKFARLARSLVLVQRSQEYVEAAVVMGFSPARILMRHIMPEFGRAADRAGDARCRQRHHHLRRALVPRPRRRSADAGMGLDGVRGARADRAMVGRGLPRPRHPDRGAGLQLPRRRHPRLARSAVAPPMSVAVESGDACRRRHADPRGARPAHAVLHRRRHRARRRRRQLLGRRRRDARHRRRIRLRQERHRAVADAAARGAAPHRRRRGALPGPRRRCDVGRGDARAARRRHRDGVPGPDDLAQPGAAHRAPAGRDDAGARPLHRASRRPPAPCRCSAAWASPRRSARSTAIRTSSPAACASASCSPWALPTSRRC